MLQRSKLGMCDIEISSWEVLTYGIYARINLTKLYLNRPLIIRILRNQNNRENVKITSALNGPS
jgi:hypothetical protein